MAAIAFAFRRDLGSILDRLGPEAVPYLRVLRRDLEGRAVSARAAWPLRIDRLTDPVLDRRLIASQALLHTVEEEAHKRGMVLTDI